jgi:hypothetical protein
MENKQKKEIKTSDYDETIKKSVETCKKQPFCLVEDASYDRMMTELQSGKPFVRLIDGDKKPVINIKMLMLLKEKGEIQF